jgi:hypothetical protein
VCSTTGHNCFVECLKHTTKNRKYSVKSLSSVTLGKKVSVNCTSATTSLPSTFCRKLGKHFAECHVALGKEKSVSRHQVTTTETLPSVYCTGTRQRSTLWAPLPILLPSAHRTSSQQREYQRIPLSAHLPSVKATTISKEALPIPGVPFLLSEFFRRE